MVLTLSGTPPDNAQIFLRLRSSFELSQERSFPELSETETAKKIFLYLSGFWGHKLRRYSGSVSSTCITSHTL